MRGKLNVMLIVHNGNSVFLVTVILYFLAIIVLHAFNTLSIWLPTSLVSAFRYLVLNVDFYGGCHRARQSPEGLEKLSLLGGAD